MRSRQRHIIGAILAALALSGCGAQAAPRTQIRDGFAQLIAALRHHDAHTVCELVFPFGQHQPAGALVTALRHSNTSVGEADYQAYVAKCAPSFAAQRANFSAYYRDLKAVSLGAITVHGSIAYARVNYPGRRGVTLRFVRAAGEWRVLEGVQ
jgi:hypothetical protein